MMTPALPPSSRTTFFLPHFSLSRHPTAALPVKLKSLKRGSTTNRSAIWFSHGSTLSPPGGTPASNATSPSNKAVKGVCGAGLIRIGFPAARAGATLCATRFKGKLNGVMPKIGPMGKRRRMPRWESVPGVQSRGMRSPPNPLGFFSGDRESLYGSRHFPARIGDRLSSLSRHQPGKLLATVIQRTGDALEDVIAAMRRQGAHRCCRLSGGLDGRLGVGLARLGDFSEDLPREGIVHGSSGVPLAPLAADEKWTWSLQQDTPRWTIGLGRGLDRRGGSRLHVRRLFGMPAPSRPNLLCPSQRSPRWRTLHRWRRRDNPDNPASEPCERTLRKGTTCRPRTAVHHRAARQARTTVYQTYGNPSSMRWCESYDPGTLDNIRSISSAKASKGNAPGIATAGTCSVAPATVCIKINPGVP